MKIWAALCVTLLLGGATAGCGPVTSMATPQVYYPSDAVQEYTQRTETITMSAGNDQDVNTRIQAVDPWPPYVGDRQIPASGQRMAGAVERYRDVSKQKSGPQPLPLESTSEGGSGGGGK